MACGSLKYMQGQAQSGLVEHQFDTHFRLLQRQKSVLYVSSVSGVAWRTALSLSCNVETAKQFMNNALATADRLANASSVIVKECTEKRLYS